MSDPTMPSHHGVSQTDVDSGREYANETMRLLLTRASCRNFRDEPVSDDVMDQILEAGCHAATGGNLQPVSIIRIEEEKSRKELAAICEQPYMARAPVHLLFCLDWRRLGHWARLEVAPFRAPDSFEHFWISFLDTAICAQSVCTAADSLGLGSVYIGASPCLAGPLRRMFRLPELVFPAVLLCMGYPKTERAPKKKLPAEAVVHRERYRDLDDAQIRKAFADKYLGLCVEITGERLELLRKVCTAACDASFAEECLEAVERQGYINPVQRYFGLHYRADEIVAENDKYLEEMEDAGFGWFNLNQD